MRTYYLEEMTWPEIEKALADAIRAHAEAGDFAKRLGKALAAPVIRPGVSDPPYAVSWQHYIEGGNLYDDN